MVKLGRPGGHRGAQRFVGVPTSPRVVSAAFTPFAVFAVLAVLTAFAVLAVAERAAHAHPETSPLAVNRYLTATVFPERVELSLAFLVGQLPGADERRRMDADGDGTIAPAERERERARLAGDGAGLAALSVDGIAQTPAWAATLELGPDATVGALPAVMEIHASVALRPGRHGIRIEPLREPARLGETEIAVEAAPGALIADAFRGDGRGPHGTRFKFQGPRVAAVEDRSVTFLAGPAPAPQPGAAAGAPRRDRPTPWWPVVAAALLLGFAHARGTGATSSPAPPAARFIGHALFPALAAVLLAYARGRLWGEPPGAAAWLVAGLALPLATASTLSRGRSDGLTGHRESALYALLVPSPAMILLALGGTLLSPGLAPLPGLAFALTSLAPPGRKSTPAGPKPVRPA